MNLQEEHCKKCKKHYAKQLKKELKKREVKHSPVSLCIDITDIEDAFSEVFGEAE